MFISIQSQGPNGLSKLKTLQMLEHHPGFKGAFTLMDIFPIFSFMVISP